ncbi:hypothetical protein K1719_042893 [Acacia pycnantha]|nr:hypothetical protein K1719_042893 [Acacia pycnantha]
MKATHKDSEKLIWDEMRSPSASPMAGAATHSRTLLQKLLVWLMLFVSVSYIVYTLKLVSTSRACDDGPFSTDRLSSSSTTITVPRIMINVTASRPIRNRTSIAFIRESQESNNQTELRHLAFGIAASAKLWHQRKNYIKLWYKPKEMRGIVWLDERVKTHDNDGLPPIKISGDTSKFPYKNRQGHRSAIRISRIVSETLRLGLKDVRWFVMGDDDTVFVTDNLLRDRCIQRYPGLYGSDDRMQACMAELGVPLTKEVGFHQYDVYGNLFGLLAAHPVTPFVSLHHLDVVEPIFPNVTRLEALKRLTIPMKLDSAGLMQQSICYDKARSWTISVSWGFAVQIFRGVFSPREMEMPSRTFLNWWKMVDPSNFDKVEVYKKPDPYLWNRAPRRNCCRVMKSKKSGTMVIDVGVCREGEVSEIL